MCRTEKEPQEPIDKEVLVYRSRKENEIIMIIFNSSDRSWGGGSQSKAPTVAAIVRNCVFCSFMQKLKGSKIYLNPAIHPLPCYPGITEKTRMEHAYHNGMAMVEQNLLKSLIMENWNSHLHLFSTPFKTAKC